MIRFRPSIPILIALVAGCSPGADDATRAVASDVQTRAPEASRIVLQAVDAGTGAALADEEVTVRHLVRFPITLDASAVARISSSELHGIEHAVSADSLVVEVRLEADSYHRVDTVFSVARGASAGPVTLRMARRLDRAGAGGAANVAGSAGAASAGSGATAGAVPAGVAGTRLDEGPAAATAARDDATPPPSTPPPSPSTAPSPSAATDPDANVDRSPLAAGDRAWEQGDWAAATNSYRRMTPPSARTGSYAREYAQALVRLGDSHIQLGEWGGALDALGEAIDFDSPGWMAHLLLTQAECAVGRVDPGRQRLGEVDRMQPTIPAAERSTALALVEYQRGLCSQSEFDRAQEPRDFLQKGTSALRELQGFIDLGEAIVPMPLLVRTSVDDARRRMTEIRERLQAGG